MNRNRKTPRLSAHLLLRMTLLFVSCLATCGALHADAANELRHLLVGRTAVFKIEMPLLKGVVVSPQGQLDQKLYYKRIKKHRPVFTPGERGEITRVLIDENQLKICFNNCGIKFLGPGSRVMGKLDKHGSALIISFPGAVTAADAAPESVLPVLEAVAVVEGLDLEQRTETAAPAPASKAPTVDAAVPRAAAGSLELLSVTVEPAEVRPGDSVRLVLQFEVVDAGLAMPITEERQIFRGDVALLDTPRSSRDLFHSGRQRTELLFQVPDDAAPGAYTLEGTVRGAGREHKSRAVFLVR